MDIEKQFDDLMLDTYKIAKEQCDYNATYFLQMLYDRGGVATARYLIATDTPSEGFTRLWECGRLDLTIEAIILRPEFAPLFTDEERELARERLAQYGYDFSEG